MDIRPMVPGDEELLGTFLELFRGERIPAERARALLADPRGIYLFACVAGVPAGWVIGYVLPRPREELLFVYELDVAGPFRRQGLGSRLVEALLVHGQERGCRKAFVLTDESNAPARGLYRKVGGEEAEEATALFRWYLDEAPAAQP